MWMGQRIVAASLAIPIVLLCAGRALADDCHPLTLLAKVDLLYRPLDARAFVPVAIDGAQRLMLLDTGGGFSEITRQAADELMLDRREAPFRQVNVAGESSDEVAEVGAFTFGGLTAHSADFVIAPERALFGRESSDYAGIIGPDILRNYDVDLDFGANSLSLLSPEHCEGKVVYWRADAVAVVPMRLIGVGQIAIAVKLDGHPLDALVDTGANVSALAAPAAQNEMGLTLGTLQTPFIGVMHYDRDARVYRHRFASLDFTGVAVANPQFDIIPRPWQRRTDDPLTLGTLIPGTGPEIAAPPMLIGMDVLRRLHLYIAYKERKLYITAAGTPAAGGAAVAPSDAR